MPRITVGRERLRLWVDEREYIFDRISLDTDIHCEWDGDLQVFTGWRVMVNTRFPSFSHVGDLLPIVLDTPGSLYDGVANITAMLVNGYGREICFEGNGVLHQTSHELSGGDDAIVA